MLETSALKLFTMVNLHYQLSHPHGCSTTVSLETYPLYLFNALVVLLLNRQPVGYQSMESYNPDGSKCFSHINYEIHTDTAW